MVVEIGTNHIDLLITRVSSSCVKPCNVRRFVRVPGDHKAGVNAFKCIIGMAEALHPLSCCVGCDMPPEPVSIVFPAKTDKCVGKTCILQAGGNSAIVLI